MSEPFAETPQESAETTQPQESAQPREKRARRGPIIGVSALTALVVLFALLFAAFTHRSIVTGGAPPTPNIPAGWQRSTDPGGHFTILIPNGWTVHSQSSSGTEGSSRGSVTFHDTMDAFGGPPNGQNTITVWIYFQPIKSNLARQVMCDSGFYQIRDPNAPVFQPGDEGSPAARVALTGMLCYTLD